MPVASPAPPPLPGLDGVHLSDVNRHDIWDARECAVSNPAEWLAACTAYKASAHFAAPIPHHLHQIWIGTRQPPCVWLDTWRLDFMSAFADAPLPSDHPWSYTLWDNQAVRTLPMHNRALFDAEPAPQCQADILRLEVLYEHGGVYVDADIVSTCRDLRPALAAARDTGFLITYEPDTKDKPYSILGNSLIACTPKHPLILMLMSYIKQIYPHKRPHYGVEWVTGPLTYTKVLVNTAMPVTIPPSKDFYPAFHYVPNPSAIDLSKVDSYCFQFGYTCSGLSQWVAENNKCRRAHDCSHHANMVYPLGKMRQFPAKLLASQQTEGRIPKVIHQFSFQSDAARPVRWMTTWQDVFCPAAGFRYELWTWQRLKDEIGAFYCANLYEENGMDSFSLHMLVLEVIQAFGGYYVPLSSIFVGDATDPEAAARIFGTGEGAEFRLGSVLGYAKERCLSEMKECYDTGKIVQAVDRVHKIAGDLVSDMGFGDEVTSFLDFKDTSRFLGASEIYYLPGVETDCEATSTVSGCVLWAYDCQVPIFRFSSEKDGISALNESGKRSMVITEAAFSGFPTLVKEMPGVIYRLDQEGTEWDFIVLNVEWEVDEDGLCVYKASCPFRSPNAHYLGFIANVHASEMVKSGNIETLLEQHETGRVFVASEKSRHSAKVARIFRAMPVLTHVCRTLAGFEPNFYREREEVVDGLLKGFRGGQVGFELQVDCEQRVMFRSWGGNGGVDCECKIRVGVSGTAVEWMKMYEDQRVAFEANGRFVR